MGSKKTTKTTSTSSNAPPAWAAQGLQTIGNKVGAAAAAGTPAYTGEFLAGNNPLEAQAIQAMQNTAATAQQYGGQLAGMVGQNAAPQFSITDMSMPEFANYDTKAIQPVIDAALHPVLRNLQESVLPGLRDSATASGAYGNSLAQETLPGVAIRNFTEDANRLAIQTAYKDFSDARALKPSYLSADTTRGLGVSDAGRANTALDAQLLGSSMGMISGAGDALGMAGTAQKALDQNTINNQLQKHQYAVGQPYEGMDIASGLLGQVANPWGTTTGTQKQTTSSSGLGEVVKGVAGLAGAAASIYTGGAAGGLSGLFKGAALPSISSLMANNSKILSGMAG